MESGNNTLNLTSEKGVKPIRRKVSAADADHILEQISKPPDDNGDLTPRRFIARHVADFQAAIAAGWDYEGFCKVLGGVGINLSAASLRAMLSDARRKAASPPADEGGKAAHSLSRSRRGRKGPKKARQRLLMKSAPSARVLPHRLPVRWSRHRWRPVQR